MSVRGKYLNPKADLTFKLVFGENKDLVMSLLNALLPLSEEEEITEVEYLSPEMVPNSYGKKFSIVDVQCKDRNGRRFLVEMQLYWDESFKQRVILNASKAVVKQVGEGEDFTLLQPVYSLNLIIDKAFDLETDEFYHDYAIVNVEHSDRIIEGLRFIFIELPKFQPKSVMEKKMAILWLRFLTEIDEKTEVVPPELLEDAATSKALGIVEKSAMSEGQLHSYENFWYSLVNERVLLDSSFKRGSAVGFAKGLEEGLEKGCAEGRAEGRAETIIELARSMKSIGIPVTQITTATGLSVSDIESL
ncbi:MAG: Rpn family recombination-promoting nuclease/putative transposase [Bacteroidaceae bacterium]|nr:Rpn family recombination-promoting nuclease/putative transposase [Bacteroidaceae bacterium]